METLNNKVTGGTLTADEWNQVPSELQNVITQTGQTLTNADLNQVGKGIAQYAGNGAFYIDSGAANAYVLTQIGTKQASTSLDDGMIIRFLVGNTNTTASTVNPATLGVTTFVNFNGEAFLGGELVAGEIVRAFFDAGNTRFQLLPEITTSNFILLKSGIKSFLINGNFDIWQRGVSFVGVNAVYTSDRWLSNDGDGAATVTQESFTVGQTTVSNEPEFFLRHNQTSASTVINAVLSQRIEGVRTFAGNKTTLSVFLKAGSSKTFAVDVQQNFGTGGSPSAIVTTASQNVAVTTSFQKFELVFDIASISGKTIGSDGNDYLSVRIKEESSFSTFTLDVAQIQYEQGTIATDFEDRPIAEELELARRYFERQSASIVNANFGVGAFSGVGALQVSYFYLVEKRVIPSIAFSAIGDFRIENKAVNTVCTSFTVTAAQKRVTQLRPVAIGLGAAGESGLLKAENTNAFVSIDAEL